MASCHMYQNQAGLKEDYLSIQECDRKGNNNQFLKFLQNVQSFKPSGESGSVIHKLQQHVYMWNRIRSNKQSRSCLGEMNRNCHLGYACLTATKDFHGRARASTSRQMVPCSHGRRVILSFCQEHFFTGIDPKQNV